MQKYCLVFLLQLLCLLATGKIVPKDSSILNYTDLVFEFEPVNKAAYYVIRFKKEGEAEYFHIQHDSTHVTFCNLFEFGKRYSWNYQAYSALSEKLFSSPSYHFQIIDSKEDEDFYFDKLLRRSYSLDGLFLIDQAKVIMTTDGREVWRMPKLKGLPQLDKISLRDLRITNAGTFTALIINNIAIEFDKDGQVLWWGPESVFTRQDSLISYHHDFRLLNKGTYMVMSNRNEQFVLNQKGLNKTALSSSEKIVESNNKLIYADQFGTLVEYSTTGEEVWRWSSADYLLERVKDGWIPKGGHSNAFFFDEQNNHVFVGFRDLNLILKIEYPSGKVVDSFGQKLSPNQRISSVNAFALQHSIEKTKNGNILIFNNDSCDKDYVSSSLVVMNENLTDQNLVVQNISLLFDKQDDGKSCKYGSADELPDGNILLGIGAKGRVVVLDPKNDYSVLLDMCLKFYKFSEWETFEFYRAHYASSLYPCYFSINRKENKLIIVNEGNQEDNYSIEVLFQSGQKRVFQSPKLGQGQKYVLDENLSTAKSLVVRSLIDKRISRELSF